MPNMQYVRICEQDENMEFIINRTTLSVIAEVGHSFPKRGKRADTAGACRQLHYIANGKCSFRGTILTAGMGYILAPDEPQGMSVDSDGFEQYWINFDDKAIAPLLFGLKIPDGSYIFDLSNDSEKNSLALVLLQGVFEKTSDKEKASSRHSHAFLTGLLLQMLSLVAESDGHSALVSPTEQYCATVCSYIRSHYSEPLTVGWLSAVVGLSPKYLIRIFRRTVGCTVIGYLSGVRLAAARGLLEETDMSIGEIARAVGYDDPLYFSKVFREKFGASPSAVRGRKGT